MKKIACVGYHDTGAGVIDCLLREFDNVAQGTYEVEARMLQDPDGVSDLEYNLIENPHRLNSGFAIKRFIKYVNKTNRSYKKIFGDGWKIISNEYAKSLVSFKFKGYWHGDIWILNPLFQLYYLFRRALSKMAPKKLRRPSWHNYFPRLESYHVNIDEKDFLKKTRDYVNKLCDCVGESGSDYIVLDQLIATNDVNRYCRYVDDLKVIIVDRDPRDIFIEQMSIKCFVLPKDPVQFCEVYRASREQKKEVDANVCMFINFEDLIYRYDESIKKVFDFIGIDTNHHVRKKEFFNPEESIKNTKLWDKYPEYSEDISIIEKQLSDMLHNYD